MITQATSILPDRQTIVIEAINKVVYENPEITKTPNEFLTKCNNEVIFRMLDYFPLMCTDARRVNLIKFNLLEDTATRGRFNKDTFWSDDKLFMYDFDIPPDLYYFMQVAVYKKFWDEDNEKIWRGFMKKICKSTLIDYECMNLLMKIKTYYGPNSDLSLTGEST